MRVGSYEAKTHLPRLLERAAGGERITITKHGVPVAVLVSANAHTVRPTSKVVEDLKQFRRGRRIGDLSIREMLESGRR